MRVEDQPWSLQSVWRDRGETGPVERTADLIGDPAYRGSRELGQAAFDRHADRDGFPVQDAEAARSFDGVADGVAEVENLARAPARGHQRRRRRT